MTSDLKVCAQCGQPHVRCRAHRKSDGQPCMRPRVYGTSVCYVHGGSAPQVQAAGRRRMDAEALDRAAREFGLPREVDPAEAIVEAIHKIAGQLDFYEAEAQALGSPWVEQRVGEYGHRLEEHPAVTAYRLTLDRFFAFSERALKLGLAERQVEVVELQGALLARAMIQLIDDPSLGLSRDQRDMARRLAGRYLRDTAIEARTS